MINLIGMDNVSTIECCEKVQMLIVIFIGIYITNNRETLQMLFPKECNKLIQFLLVISTYLVKKSTLNLV